LKFFAELAESLAPTGEGHLWGGPHPHHQGSSTPSTMMISLPPLTIDADDETFH
jgi:hypothetical protein